MKENYIEALQELVSETNQIRESYSLTTWKNKATNLLIRIYGKEGEPIKQVSGFNYYERITNISELQTRTKNFIEGLIKEIERFDLPDLGGKVQEQGFHINITQNQNQETKVSLQLFVDAIQDELKGSQLKELQEILNEEEIPKEDKKTKIIQKLKSFGGDVASNIVAGILTNPALYGG